MPESAFEHHRALFAASLAAVAEHMRTCAQIAESFAKIVDDSPDAHHLLNGKGKAHATDDDGPKKRKRNTKPKDPNAPKRPASSYINFQNAVRGELKKLHPDLSNAELLSKISDLWKDLPASEKEVYNQQMRDQKVEYAALKEAYDKRTPAEIEAANVALADALTLKKANAKPRGPKAKYAVPAPVPAKAAVDETVHSSDVSEEDDDDSEEDPHPVKPHETESSEEEEEEEEPEQPVQKKRRGASAQPKEKGKKSKA
ncbi:hypothetical protein HYPSUDRAFT_41851 [Hypholoma sublateritium FD-334 SS-4]|uniref:HMG box domain-containing protein n=1 Tax=Hypholoma sublateritium (strain FD-334 SS-4) TaxID=945553 RepID=A0A0D2NSB7_HYPSF|nr:hypothetical protein HYPSUDRAFT_41851 [Hypholoma sublateritium FD-334 SS-4]